METFSLNIDAGDFLLPYDYSCIGECPTTIDPVCQEPSVGCDPSRISRLINGFDYSVFFALPNEDLRKVFLAKDSTYTVQGFSNVGYWFQWNAYNVVNSTGMCGGATMGRDGVYDYVNNRELSDAVSGTGIFTCTYDLDKITNSVDTHLYLTEFSAFQADCTNNPYSCVEASYLYNNLLLPTVCGKKYVVPNDQVEAVNYLESVKNFSFAFDYPVSISNLVFDHPIIYDSKLENITENYSIAEDTSGEYTQITGTYKLIEPYPSLSTIYLAFVGDTDDISNWSNVIVGSLLINDAPVPITIDVIFPTLKGCTFYISNTNTPNPVYECINGEKECSRFLSTEPEALICQLWSENAYLNGDVTTQSIIDSVKEGYCFKNPTAKECECLTRSSDENYQAVKVNSPDYCWYAPCQNSLNLTTFRDEARVSTETCAETCAKIYNLYVDGEIEFKFEEGYENTISCNFSDTPLPPNPSPTGPSETVSDIINTYTVEDKYTYGVSIIVIFLLMIVFIIFCF
jgi:hypothetical protein